VKLLLVMVALCAAAGLAEAQNVVGKTKTNVGTGHRVDANTAGVLSVMPKSLHDDLVLWQMFSYSDNSDANFYDLSTSGNDGAQTTASQQPSHQTTDGGHYDLDGVDDYFIYAAQVIPLGAKTIAFWFDSTTSSTVSIFDNSASKTANNGTSIYLTSAGLIKFLSTKGSAGDSRFVVTGTGDLSDGNWHHVVAAWDGTTDADMAKLYVDGAEDDSETADSTEVSSATYNLFMGKFNTPYDNFYDGLLDDIRIYDRSITAAEVLAIALAGAATYYPYFSTNDYDLADYVDLALWLPFDSDETPDYIDKGPIGNDGTQATASEQPTFSSDNGGVYSFDGVDDSFVVADDASLRITDTLTLSCWLNRSSAGTRDYIFSKGDDIDFWFEIGATDLITLWISATGSSAPTNYDYYREDASSIAIGLWHYVAVTLTASTRDFKIYVNGSESAGTVLGTAQGSIYASTAPLGVGFREKYSDNYFDGQLDDTRIYDRALSAAEILAIGNRTGSTYYPYFSTDDYDFDDYMDLALWLPFDTDETPDYIDKGPIGNDGSQATASDQPTFSSDNGGVYSFDGVDDSISIAASTSLNAIGNLMTITAWLKLDAHGWQMILIKGTGAAHPIPFQFSFNPDGDLNFYQSEGGAFVTAIAGTVPVPTNQWTFVAAVNDGSDAFVYINAVQADTDATPATAVDTDTETLGLGANVVAGTSFIDGFLDDVRIYDRGITAAEVLAIYNNTKATYGL